MAWRRETRGEIEELITFFNTQSVSSYDAETCLKAVAQNIRKIFRVPGAVGSSDTGSAKSV